ncbi:pilus assembly FimT family protein [Crocosphaera sp.]|uniref:pilus assembly FimT family protein n=1 Tax=Crocosphaera sp. TaxID=2729996 RepID=UPI003F26B5F2|nr:hypothetical protein [Crocosphaera sp.]
MLKIYLKLLQKSRPSAGWTLAELMIAAGMTTIVVLLAGFGLVTVLKEDKVANATGEMQYDLNRATEFISEEIRSAKTIEAQMADIERNAKTFLEKHPGKTPILALKIDGVYERVVYYIDEVGDDEIWRGPGVIRRFGPHFDVNGKHDPDSARNPDKWQSIALVDGIALKRDKDPALTDLSLDASQIDSLAQCKNLPHDPDKSDGVNSYIATDNEGQEWYRFPQKKEDVLKARGFFSCVRADKQLAQINLVGSSFDEFKHLYEEGDVLQKKSRHLDKMEYGVSTMVHARSEAIGSAGEEVPSYTVDSLITFQEKGNATITVLHANIPCSDGTTSSDIATYFVRHTDLTVVGKVFGLGTGSTVEFEQSDQANAHLIETKLCSAEVKDRITAKNAADIDPNVKFATNDNSDHTKLNDIILNPSPTIVSKLSQAGFIKTAKDGSYDFTLPDNIVLYFLELSFVVDDPIKNPTTGKWEFKEETDPHFDDVIFFVEMTK